MKLASVLTPLSDHNLTLAAQAGVEEVVVRYPGPDLSLIDDLKDRIESFGLRIGVVEGRLPIDAIKLGRDDGTEMREWKALVRHLGAIGIPIVCYNFMAGTDWIRTSVDAPERGEQRSQLLIWLTSSMPAFRGGSRIETCLPSLVCRLWLSGRISRHS